MWQTNHTQTDGRPAVQAASDACWGWRWRHLFDNRGKAEEEEVHVSSTSLQTRTASIKNNEVLEFLGEGGKDIVLLVFMIKVTLTKF